MKADRLIIFPEGTRVGAWCASGFAGGFFAGALQAARPAGGADCGGIAGGSTIMSLKRPGRITYKIGEPIPAGLPPRGGRGAECTRRINALNR